VICQPFSTYDNYPFLACYGEARERLVLWPEDDFSAPLACEN
jgi:hypothetical protein